MGDAEGTVGARSFGNSRIVDLKFGIEGPTGACTVYFMTNKETCLTFPCSFPLKVMGFNTEEFSAAVLAILHKHLDPGGMTVSRRPSSGDKYLSLTVTFIAESKDQLDAIYRELNSHHLVLMTL